MKDLHSWKPRLHCCHGSLKHSLTSSCWRVCLHLLNYYHRIPLGRHPILRLRPWLVIGQFFLLTGLLECGHKVHQGPRILSETGSVISASGKGMCFQSHHLKLLLDDMRAGSVVLQISEVILHGLKWDLNSFNWLSPETHHPCPEGPARGAWRGSTLPCKQALCCPLPSLGEPQKLRTQAVWTINAAHSSEHCIWWEIKGE